MDGIWIPGPLCTGGYLATSFQGSFGYDLEKAKAICTLDCNEIFDCKFASLYYSETKQRCYLYRENCGNWQDYQYRRYYFYEKGATA